MRVKIRSFGRFFECNPVRNRLASFLPAKNSSEVASSNGWISFLREKLMALGRLRAYCHLVLVHDPGNLFKPRLQVVRNAEEKGRNLILGPHLTAVNSQRLTGFWAALDLLLNVPLPFAAWRATYITY